MRRQMMDPAMRRKYVIFVALAYVTVLPAAVLQVYFFEEHDQLALIVTGVIFWVGIVATSIYAKRSGLTRRLRR